MMTRVVPDRIGVGVLTAVTNMLWGVRANLVADVVAENGSIRALAWFGRNMPQYEWILARWGPIRTHLVSALLSLDNGCAYAVHGHAHAFQLHYFRDNDQLFPLSDDEVLELIGANRDVVVESVGQALEMAGLDAERHWIVRALEIKDGTPVENSDDAHLRHLANMFQWLNAHGIRAGTDVDGAHDPINKDAQLRARYTAARESTAP